MDIDLRSREMIDDPYPGYEKVRAEGEVVWNSRTNSWLLTSDRLCRKVLLDHGHYVIEGTIVADVFGEDAFFTIDNKKRHDELRNIWMVAFQHGALVKLQHRIAQM